MVTKIRSSIPTIPVLENIRDQIIHKKDTHNHLENIRSKLKIQPPEITEIKQIEKNLQKSIGHLQQIKKLQRNENQILMGPSHSSRNKWEYNSNQGNKTTHKNRK